MKQIPPKEDHSVRPKTGCQLPIPCRLVCASAGRYFAILLALYVVSCSRKADLASPDHDANLKEPTAEEVAEGKENWAKLEMATLARDAAKANTLTGHFLYFECEDEVTTGEPHWTAHAAFELTKSEKPAFDAAVAQDHQEKMIELLEGNRDRENSRPHFFCVLRLTDEQKQSLSQGIGFSRKLSIYGRLQAIAFAHRQITVGPIHLAGWIQL